jgi:hypothetical protein
MREVGKGGRRGVLALLVAAIAVGASALLPSQASGTTGPYILRPPKYRVSPSVAKLYPGRYSMRGGVKGARLRGGNLGIEVNDNGFLDGVAQFEAFDARGVRTVWVATLYDFKNLGHGRMQFNVLGPGGTPLLALMRVVRDKHGNFKGQFVQDGHTYPISWRRTAIKP